VRAEILFVFPFIASGAITHTHIYIYIYIYHIVAVVRLYLCCGPIDIDTYDEQVYLRAEVVVFFPSIFCGLDVDQGSSRQFVSAIVLEEL
jgi:hypothetical protein